MKFSLEFGETENHLLEFSFNQLLGTAIIKVNNKIIKKHTRWFSEPLQQTHEVEVGQNEVWRVRIEKERKMLYGQKYRVYVNQRLAKVCEGV
jgi:hypothetical protein